MSDDKNVKPHPLWPLHFITGHKTLGEVQRYTNDVDQRRLAETAAGHLVGAKRERKFGKLLPRSGKLPPKPLK